MYCKNCGRHLAEEAIVCPACGVATEKFYQSHPATKEDNPSVILKIASFIYPILGVILYIIYENKQPKCASSYMKHAIYGTLFAFVMVIFYIILIALL